MRALAVLLTAAVVTLAGCDIIDALTGRGVRRTEPDGSLNANTGSTTDEETGEAGLKTFGSAEELKSYFASMASAGFRNDPDVIFDLLQDVPGGEAAAPGDADGSVAESPDAPVAAPDAGQDDTFSGTTTQEAGVQESDIIKNDGTYVYVLTQNTLRVVRVNPGEQMELLASQELEGWGRDLYTRPDSASVATQIVAITQPDAWYGGFPGPVLEIAQAEPSVAPDAGYYRPRTVVTVIDVSDHANPVVQSQVTFEGTLAHSRMIDGVLYMVLTDHLEYFVDILPAGGGEPDPDDVDLDAILPDYTVTSGDGRTAGGNIINWDGFYRPMDPDGFGMTTIVRMAVDDPEDFDAKAVVAYPGNLYASPEAIYLTDTDFNFLTGDYRETTDIYKFALTETGVELVATGVVEGRVLNQYSMSEYEGYLRVATTTSGIWFGDEVSPSVNHLYILQETEGRLEVVGSIENLAPGESIYSARFIGPRGYLVTFQQIDPLFTLDLSDPTNPVKAGELKVPGFSSFIVPMGPDHLLTVGRDVRLEGDWAIPTGVQLSIFDISNFADPQLRHTEIIGTEDTRSEAVDNPKAFTYFAARDLLALPIQVYEWAFGGFVEPEESPPGAPDEPEVEAAQAAGEVEPGFNGVYIYRVTPDEGFVYLGKMSTRREDDSYYWGSWFTRGVFMDENCYAVTERGVVGALLSDVNSAPWQVRFPVDEPQVGGDEPVSLPDEPGGAGAGDTPSAGDAVEDI